MSIKARMSFHRKPKGRYLFVRLQLVLYKISIRSDNYETRLRISTVLNIFASVNLIQSVNICNAYKKFNIG